MSVLWDVSMTVIHLISTDNKLKTLTHETLLFNKLALFSVGRWGILNTKQSIKVNDPAIQKSVTAEHCCIISWSSGYLPWDPHSISGLSWGWGPEVLVLWLALINKFCSNGENNRGVNPVSRVACYSIRLLWRERGRGRIKRSPLWIGSQCTRKEIWAQMKWLYQIEIDSNPCLP